jgi:hypothetical protein
MRMFRKSSSLVGVVALSVCLFAVPAQASDTYPAAVQEALGLPCAPACVLCHDRPEGGLGNLNQQFGPTFQATGVSIRNPGGVAAALACIENGVADPSAEPCPYRSDEPAPDSDGDGTPDIEELRNSEDPNSSTGGSFCGARYGCGARIAPPKAQLDGLASASALLVAGALLWSLRRRGR